MFGSKKRRIDQLQRDLAQARKDAAHAAQGEAEARTVAAKAKEAAAREYDAKRQLQEVIDDIRSELSSGKLTPSENQQADAELQRALAVYSDPTR